MVALLLSGTSSFYRIPGDAANPSPWPPTAPLTDAFSMDDQAAADPLRPRYKRVVLKLSGECFGYPGKSGISVDETLNIARQSQRVLQRGVQLAIVVGAGNILRGAQFSAGGDVIKEGTAHYM